MAGPAHKHQDRKDDQLGFPQRRDICVRVEDQYDRLYHSRNEYRAGRDGGSSRVEREPANTMLAAGRDAGANSETLVVESVAARRRFGERNSIPNVIVLQKVSGVWRILIVGLYPRLWGPWTPARSYMP